MAWGKSKLRAQTICYRYEQPGSYRRIDVGNKFTSVLLVTHSLGKCFQAMGVPLNKPLMSRMIRIGTLGCWIGISREPTGLVAPDLS